MGPTSTFHCGGLALQMGVTLQRPREPAWLPRMLHVLGSVRTAGVGLVAMDGGGGGTGSDRLLTAGGRGAASEGATASVTAFAFAAAASVGEADVADDALLDGGSCRLPHVLNLASVAEGGVVQSMVGVVGCGQNRYFSYGGFFCLYDAVGHLAVDADSLNPLD